VKPQAAWALFFGEERDAYVLGLLRLAISALLFFNGGRLILELTRGGYFGDFFHIPMVPESWLPARSGYAGLLAIQAIAVSLAFLGVWPREALFVASCLGLFLLSCDRLQYHNNRYVLLLLGFLLAFAPCDRSFLIARGGARQLSAQARKAPTFARRLFQLQVSLVYLGSAGGKLLDSDWRTGQVLLIRLAKTAQICAERGLALPPWLNLTLSSPVLASLLAKAAISSELFIALGSWLPHTRRLALWVGVMFHFGIEVSARVELFSWVMGASYLAFVQPEVRERKLEFDAKSARGRALSRLVSALDWLARFELTALSEREPEGASFVVTGRDGRRLHGIAATAELAAALPVLFPLWLPLSLLARHGRSQWSLSKR
jgi:Vitamin K-dependent gamma-carboxylase